MNVWNAAGVAIFFAGSMSCESSACERLLADWRATEDAMVAYQDLVVEPSSDEGTYVSDSELERIRELTDDTAAARDEAAAEGCF